MMPSSTSALSVGRSAECAIISDSFRDRPVDSSSDARRVTALRYAASLADKFPAGFGETACAFDGDSELILEELAVVGTVTASLACAASDGALALGSLEDRHKPIDTAQTTVRTATPEAAMALFV